MTPDDRTSVDSIVHLLAAASTAIGVVEKKERNTQGTGFNFRGIDTVVNAASPEFRERGIIVTPETLDRVYEQLEVGKNRSLMGHVMLRVRYTFHGPAGDSIAATVDAEAMDSGDKATAKAMSVALRTALLQALMLPTDEQDPDANSYERSTAASKPTAKPAVEGASKDDLLHVIEVAKSEGYAEALKSFLSGFGGANARAWAAMTKENRDKAAAIACGAMTEGAAA